MTRPSRPGSVSRHEGPDRAAGSRRTSGTAPAAHTHGLNRDAGPWRPSFTLGVLALLVGAVYLQTAGHAWVHWDDDTYVFANPDVLGGLSFASLRWALTTFQTATWQPVTLISYLVDATIWGARPGGYHLVNTLLHAVNAMLLFTWLRGLSKAPVRSAVVAAIFAVHPVNAEVVAWISGRKDLLAAFFALLSLLAYTRYARQPSIRRGGPVILMFALALAAKPVVMTLPVLLLMLDAGPLRRITDSPSRRRVILEKMPLFALSLASLAVTYLAQRSAGAVSGLGEITPGMRLGNAVNSLAAYLWMLAVPARLACFYPYESLPAARIAGAAALLAAISFLAIRLRRACPAVLPGWIWYLLALIPTIGLVQVGSQARADRYLYLPMIGIVIAVTWGVHALIGSASTASTLARRRRAALALAGLSILTLTVLGIRQAATWKDDVTLFGHAARVTRGNYIAENKLGVALATQGRTEEGRVQLAEAVRVNPRFLDAWVNLGTVEERLGHPKEAFAAYRRALEIAPADPRAVHGIAVTYTNLGADAAGRGDVEEGIRCFQEALRALPGFEPAETNLRKALAARTGATPNR